MFSSEIDKKERYSRVKHEASLQAPSPYRYNIKKKTRPWNSVMVVRRVFVYKFTVKFGSVVEIAGSSTPNVRAIVYFRGIIGGIRGSLDQSMFYGGPCSLLYASWVVLWSLARMTW